MLVPILNTTDRSGGAGIAAFRQSEALEGLGLAAPVLCLHRRFNDERSFRYRPRTSEQSRTLQVYRDALQSVQRRFVTDNRSSVSRTIFSPPWAGSVLVGDNPLVESARVVHLHWVNHFLDLHALQELVAARKPIVWTLHDEWLFTAGCHYTSGCEQFLTGCSDCPQLLHDPYRLVAHWFAQKAALLTDANLVVVTPSEWLAERARRSALLRGKRVEVVRNTFDSQVFAKPAPAARRELRQRHGFDDDTVVIGFGAQSLRDVRKGFGLLVQALQGLDDPSRVGLLVFGSRSEALDELAGRMRIAYAGELHEAADIAGVLGASDCFVVPSLEENYPNVIIEALLCGTPVIAYACGGIAEQVRHRENGLLVEPVGSADALREALAAYTGDAALRAGLRHFDRDAVAATHAPAKIGGQLIELYRSVAPDFDAPLDPRLSAYLRECRGRMGPARDFLGLPSYRVTGDDPVVNTLVADHVDRQRELRAQEARAAAERQYLGFFGATHRFGRDGDGGRFLTHGWSTPEAQGIWSSERNAGLAAAFPPGGRTVTLRLAGACRGTSQVAILRLGTSEVARIRLTPQRTLHEVRFAVPEFARAGGIVQLHLDFPHAQPEPGSARRLGLHLGELTALIETGTDPA
ncbi:MAG TPA: glycosyltransferase [Methylibium sp.]|nr:glycosyltransferase [Methylibium sp.]